VRTGHLITHFTKRVERIGSKAVVGYIAAHKPRATGTHQLGQHIKETL